jgi:hypothetical protein
MTWEICDHDSWEVLPTVLPSTWTQIGLGVFQHINGLRVISSVARDTSQDNRRWQHVSLSRPDRLPTNNDTMNVKQLFIGLERKAIQVLPKASEHCNDHPYCLHLWSCLDGDRLPDFRINGQV